jgi:homocysteine S-methyltransferase
MPTLRELLTDGRVHVADGAMGTMLYARGVYVNVCYDELNVRQPDVVRDVHRDYIRAGARLVETNTFGANPFKLAHYGLAADTETLNAAAAGIAREAAGGRDVAVLGAMGPLGIRLEPFGETSVEEARTAFARQASGLAAGGVDGFILETFMDVEELRAAVEGVRRVSNLAIIAQMTVGEDGRTHYGTAPADFGPVIAAMGVDAVGVNCSVGPHGVLEAIESLAKVVTLPLTAMPNAGLPREVSGRKMYMASPEYMASYARRMVEAGARVVGGCCGTTPDHIKAMTGFVQSVSPRHVAVAVPAPVSQPAIEPAPLAERSRYGAKIAGNSDTSKSSPGRGSRRCSPGPRAQGGRVDAVNVPGPRLGRMGALCRVDEAGSRPRGGRALRLPRPESLGMLSDLLGAAAAGSGTCCW